MFKDRLASMWEWHSQWGMIYWQISLQRGVTNQQVVINTNQYTYTYLLFIIFVSSEIGKWFWMERRQDVSFWWDQGPHLNKKTVFPGMGIPMLKIRWLRDRLIFNMGILISVRRLYIEMAPRFRNRLSHCTVSPMDWMSTHTKTELTRMKLKNLKLDSPSLWWASI